jgi:aromatic ring-opening dioxygenase catalytic subunit (LigB family)
MPEAHPRRWTRAAYVGCGYSSTGLILNDNAHIDLVEALEKVASMLDPDHLPRAIVAVSSQWQTDEVLVTSAEEPGFQRDYPELETEYGGLPCPPGAPDVAAEMLRLLQAGGIKCKADKTAKLADAVVGPTSLIFPAAEVPVVSMSILASLRAEDHVRIGSLLSPLCKEDVFFLGVGFSSNSFSLLPAPGDPLVLQAVKLFKKHLDLAVSGERDKKAGEALVKWERLPGARFNHMTEEHLMPLMVVAGAAGDMTATTVDTSFLGMPLSNYIFR